MRASQKQRIAGWIISGLLSAFLILGTVMGQLVQWEGKAEQLDHIGYSADLTSKIGIVSVVLCILFLIPRTSFVGAILLTGYFGGAVATHVRVGDPFFMALIFGVLVWIGLGLRRPEVFQLAWGSTTNSRSTARDASP